MNNHFFYCSFGIQLIYSWKFSISQSCAEILFYLVGSNRFILMLINSSSFTVEMKFQLRKPEKVPRTEICYLFWMLHSHNSMFRQKIFLSKNVEIRFCNVFQTGTDLSRLKHPSPFHNINSSAVHTPSFRFYF